ncbi:hypothetical protein TYRP_012103 [Tyrophagus putrescentiae]|nr:hypothetical protein TYRP_012103 [Tyrophagus putrescentiae]
MSVQAVQTGLKGLVAKKGSSPNVFGIKSGTIAATTATTTTTSNPSTSTYRSPWDASALVSGAETVCVGKKVTAYISPASNKVYQPVKPPSKMTGNFALSSALQQWRSNAPEDDDSNDDDDGDKDKDKDEVNKNKKSVVEESPAAAAAVMEVEETEKTPDHWEVTGVSPPFYSLVREITYADTFFTPAELKAAQKLVWFKKWKKGEPKKVSRGYKVSWLPSTEFDDSSLVTKFLDKLSPEAVKTLNVVEPFVELTPEYEKLKNARQLKLLKKKKMQKVQMKTTA